MNILQVFNGFSDRWNANGYYALALSEALAELGHKVICVCDQDSPFHKKAMEKGLKIHSLAVDTNNPLSYFSIKRNILDLINTHEIDVINCHRGMVMAAYIKAASASGRDVQIIRTHGEPKFPNTGFFSKREKKQIHKIIATTDRMKDFYIQNFNIEEQRIRTIYGSPSTDIHIEASNAERSDKPGSPAVIGMIGRMSDSKGHRTALEAVRKVIDQGGDVYLKIATGKFQERTDEFRAYAEELGVSASVEFLGYVESIPEFIQSTDIGIIPSLVSEMICRVLMEFMAFGKPVIGSKVNAVGEVIGKSEAGITFPPGDADALAQGILKIISDQKLLTALSSNSKQAYTSQYTPQKFAEATLEFYQE
jgi:glycosyltransferase involved in cell wall biosynthesis